MTLNISKVVLIRSPKNEQGQRYDGSAVLYLKKFLTEHNFHALETFLVITSEHFLSIPSAIGGYAFPLPKVERENVESSLYFCATQYQNSILITNGYMDLFRSQENCISLLSVQAIKDKWDQCANTHFPCFTQADPPMNNLFGAGGYIKGQLNSYDPVIAQPRFYSGNITLFVSRNFFQYSGKASKSGKYAGHVLDGAGDILNLMQQNQPLDPIDYVNCYPRNVITNGDRMLLHFICADSLTWWNLAQIESKAAYFAQTPLIIQGDRMDPVTFFGCIYTLPFHGERYPLHCNIPQNAIQELGPAYQRIHLILTQIPLIIFADSTQRVTLQHGNPIQKVGGIYRWILSKVSLLTVDFNQDRGTSFRIENLLSELSWSMGAEQFYYSIYDTSGL